MLSRLDNFFKTTLSHVERADTRRDVIKDDRKRKKKPLSDEEDRADIFHDDATTVSVQALLTLLENMLFTKAPDVSGDSDQAGEVPVFKGEDRRNKKPVTAAAKAARAYGQRAYQESSERRRRQPAGQVLEPGTEGNPAKSSPASQDQTLSEDEKKHIEALIADLKILMQKDVYQLSIRGGHDSFLDNLISTVKLARRAAGPL